MLEVRDLHTNYGGIAALRGISFDVPRGSVVALVGANGAGKSTTLNTISGLLAPRRGTIHFEGRDIAGWRAERVAALGLVQVPEGRQVLAPLSVEENLLVGAYTRRDGGVRADLAGVYERFPRLAERRAQIAGSLSGGEQQMLAIGRALMTRPRLLMLDEPSQGIMPKLVDEIFQAVKRIRDAGMTVLIVEQRMSECLEIADRAYILQTGRVLMQGSAADIRVNPDVRKAYLGL